MTNYFQYFSLFSPLSSIEKVTLYALLMITSILVFDFIRTNLKKKRNSKMLKDYLYVKNSKWNEVIDLLTTPNHIQASDIQNKLQIDISKFDPRYRDLFYYELVKVNHDETINVLNLRLFINTLYNRKNVRIK